MIKVISLVSLKGGTGRTTLTANLAHLLGQGRQQCLAVDLDPQNALGLHFGMSLGGREGLVWSALSPTEVSVMAHRSKNQDPYLPFGRCSEADLVRAERELALHPRWLREVIENAAPRGCQFAVLDTPAGRNPWMRQALATSDVAIVVLTPDAGAFATLPQLEALLSEWTQHQSRFQGAFVLVNMADPRSALSRDTFDALCHMLPARTLPIQVPFDEAAREALARQRPIMTEAAHSQVLEVLWKVGEWLTKMLGVSENVPRLKAAPTPRAIKAPAE